MEWQAGALALQIGYRVEAKSRIFSSAWRVKESFQIFARAKLVGRSPTRSAFRLELL
jgi:hypothetical protein